MLAAEGEGSLIGRLSAGVNKRAGVESESGTSYIKRKLVKMRYGIIKLVLT